jgi:hypothetical protein
MMRTVRIKGGVVKQYVLKPCQDAFEDNLQATTWNAIFMDLLADFRTSYCFSAWNVRTSIVSNIATAEQLFEGDNFEKFLSGISHAGPMINGILD